MNAILQTNAGIAPQEAPAMWLRRLWERMVAMYGHGWANVHGVTPHEASGALTLAGDTWSRMLTGLGALQIAAGIEACVAEGKEFPPSAPRFRAMCLNIPRIAAVREELRARGKQPSRFTRAVWLQLDLFRYRQASADQADRLLREAYDLVHDRVMRGEALPDEPAGSIGEETPATVPATAEQTAAHIRAIRIDLHGGTA